MGNNIILYFFIYSILGWMTEVIFCFIVDKEIVNRGFLRGPICPIYGVGAVLMILLIGDFKENILVVFSLGLLIASVVEYITSYFLEFVFQTKWWDYSNNKLNINGRVCLFNSVLFGVLSIALVEFIHPFIKSILDKLSTTPLNVLCIVLIIIFLMDLYKSVKAILAINHNVYKLQTIIEELKVHNSVIINTSQDDDKNRNNKIKERLRNKLNKKIKLSDREKLLIKAFPKVKHKKYHEGFERLKKMIKK